MSRILKLVAVLALLLASAALAQNYSIDWYNVGGGGGTSSGGNYTLTGTIGQPSAGTSAGGNYTLTGGFLSIVTAIQTPGAPQLTVARSGGSVIISWPDPSTDYVLQEATSLANPSSATSWNSNGSTISTNNGQKQITITSPVGNKYFRLQKL